MRYGALTAVGSYGWEGAICSVGTTGAASFTAPSGDLFFVVVAGDGSREGSYGRATGGTERPEAVGTTQCDRLQALDQVICE